MFSRQGQIGPLYLRQTTQTACMNACTKKHCQDALEVKVNKKERTFIQFHKHRIKVLSRQYFDSSCLNYLKFKESVIIFQYILLKLNSVKEIDLISWTQQRTPNFVSYLTKMYRLYIVSSPICILPKSCLCTNLLMLSA